MATVIVACATWLAHAAPSQVTVTIGAKSSTAFMAVNDATALPAASLIANVLEGLIAGVSFVARAWLKVRTITSPALPLPSSATVTADTAAFPPASRATVKSLISTVVASRDATFGVNNPPPLSKPILIAVVAVVLAAQSGDGSGHRPGVPPPPHLRAWFRGALLRQ